MKKETTKIKKQKPTEYTNYTLIIEKGVQLDIDTKAKTATVSIIKKKIK